MPSCRIWVRTGQVSALAGAVALLAAGCAGASEQDTKAACQQMKQTAEERVRTTLSAAVQRDAQAVQSGQLTLENTQKALGDIGGQFRDAAAKADPEVSAPANQVADQFEALKGSIQKGQTPDLEAMQSSLRDALQKLGRACEPYLNQ